MTTVNAPAGGGDAKDSQDAPRWKAIPKPQRVPIQILSDLHLEYGKQYSDYTFEKTAPHLALLGDIGQTSDDGYLVFLQRMLARYDKVFLVLGNHEGYDSTYDESRQKVRTLIDDAAPGQLILLDRSRHDIGDLTILGCTLWSKIVPEHEEDIQKWLPDFKYVKDWTPSDYVHAHNGDVQWLNAEVAKIAAEEPHRRIVIFTHHAPTIDGSSDPQYDGSPYQSAFSTELTHEPCWTTTNVTLWAFGHTHWCCDFVRGDVRALQNARGYPWERDRSRFNGKKVVEA